MESNEQKSLLGEEVMAPIMEQSFQMDLLGESVVLSFLGKKRTETLTVCMGDIYKTVNALMDYARLLELAVKEWNLEGYHRMTYEIHAEEYRKVAQKYADGIGYDYQKALETCKKKQSRRDEGVGEDALVLSVRQAQRDAEGARANEGESEQ
mgnify:CR=1 FL=1